MGARRELVDERRWSVLASKVAKLTSRGPKGDLLSFIQAVAWILRTGSPWRDLSPRYGRWDRIYRRFRRWALAGRWDVLHEDIAPAFDATALLRIDSTIVKAHPHAAGALRRNGGQAFEALGRSRGGFTTKLHALVTERGRLVRYVLTGGEAADITYASHLVLRREGVAVIGDRAYDADAFIDEIRSLGMRAVIPSRRGRRKPRRLDRVRYRSRNVIDRWFGRLKAFRRVATRFEKTSTSYAAFVVAAAMLVALTGWSR